MRHREAVCSVLWLITVGLRIQTGYLTATLTCLLCSKNMNSRIKQCILLFLGLGYAVGGPFLCHVISNLIQQSGPLSKPLCPHLSKLWRVCVGVSPPFLEEILQGAL